MAGWTGTIALAVGAFLAITHEAIPDRGGPGIDRALLLGLARLRTPHLTGVMIDLTALGSSTLVTIFTAVTFAILIVLGDKRGAVHLAAASIGATFLTQVTKNVIERARPTEVQHLVQVTGYSYPSGHSIAAASLYLTIAIVAGSHLEAVASRAVLFAGAALMVVLVAISRVYLGVHYPTDVAAGVALGAAWALILAATIALLIRRRTAPHGRAS